MNNAVPGANWSECSKQDGVIRRDGWGQNSLRSGQVTLEFSQIEKEPDLPRARARGLHTPRS